MGYLCVSILYLLRFVVIVVDDYGVWSVMIYWGVLIGNICKGKRL